MRIIYEADDGKQFDNEYDCNEYEFYQDISDAEIKAYDIDGNELQDLTSVKTFNAIDTIIIKDLRQVEYIRKIYKYTGYYQEIDSIGTWKWNDDKQLFVKEEM